MYCYFRLHIEVHAGKWFAESNSVQGQEGTGNEVSYMYNRGTTYILVKSCLIVVQATSWSSHV